MIPQILTGAGLAAMVYTVGKRLLERDETDYDFIEAGEKRAKYPQNYPNKPKEKEQKPQSRLVPNIEQYRPYFYQEVSPASKFISKPAYKLTEDDAKKGSRLVFDAKWHKDKQAIYNNVASIYDHLYPEKQIK